MITSFIITQTPPHDRRTCLSGAIQEKMVRTLPPYQPAKRKRRSDRNFCRRLRNYPPMHSFPISSTLPAKSQTTHTQMLIYTCDRRKSCRSSSALLDCYRSHQPVAVHHIVLHSRHPRRVPTCMCITISSY